MRAARAVSAALAGLALLCGAAGAQTPPNWGYRYVPTTAEWNAVFAGKQDYLGAPPLLSTGGTMTGPLITAASTTGHAGLNLLPGTAPTSPQNGDLWVTSAGIFARINGATVGPLVSASGGTFAASAPLSLSFPSGVVTYGLTGGAAGAPLLAGSPAAFGALNLLNGSSASGAPTGSKFLTSDSVGRANPQKYYGATGFSALFGLPYNGRALQANFSGDGSFASNDLVEQQLVTWDKTSDHGTNFMNPVSIPLYDDSTYYNFKAQNVAFVSQNQSMLVTCFEASGFTISGGQITAVGALPACASGTSYPPSATIQMRLYESPGFGTGCSFTATTNGSGGISGYSGLPCGSGLTAGFATLYFQSPASACVNNGCLYDVGPQLYLSRQPPTYWPAAGSLLAAVFFSGPTNSANAIGAQANYAALTASVVDPSASSPKGVMYLSTASPFTLNAGSTPRVGVGNGMFMTDVNGLPLSDPGEGNLAAYQLQIASATNKTVKWAFFSNAAGNTLDLYNFATPGIAWSFGADNGLYSLGATGGSKGAGTVNAAGVFVNGAAVGFGTVTSVSVVTANGVSGSVANPTTTPAVTLTLGAITPSSAAVGAGSAITTSGPGGAMTSSAFTANATANTAGTLVLRDGSGNFSAGTITAALVGNASTASAVAASGLTGTTLAAGVTASSLTSLGTIASLTATTINAFTLGGTISGGGNALNNIVIGGTTPLAGTFTTLTANTSATIGVGGTGASTLTQVLVNGASGSGSGPYIQFSKNSVSKWQFGVASTQGGSSDDFVFFGATAGGNAMTIGASDNRVTFGAQAFHPSVASDTATTDSTACIKSSDGQLLKGTGTLGICLGTSGRQFKTAFEPMRAGMDEVARIKLWNYRYRSGFGDDGARLQYGPTAQDVDEVIPDLVRHDERGIAINYDIGAFVPISLRALQQLNERVKTLENRR